MISTVTGLLPNHQYEPAACHGDESEFTTFRVDVDDRIIRLIGDGTTLEQAVDRKPEASGGVRRCGQRWHAGRNETANSYVIEVVR